MKKIYLLLMGLTVAGGLTIHAQAPGSKQMFGVKPVDALNKSVLEERTDGTFWIDYGEYDGTLHTVNYYAGITDGTYGYQHNNYDTLTGSFAVAYNRFDTLITTPDYATYNWDANSTVSTLTIDSIFVWIDHTNNSGNNDTIDVSLVGLDAARRPTDVNFWSTQEVTNSSLGQVVLAYAPGEVRTGSNWGFAVRVEYSDPSVLDTFNIIFGQIDLCEPSEVYPVCFYRVNIGAANSILIPTASDAGYWYQDCNTNSTADWPEENSFTHWGVWAQVTVVDNLGMDEQNAKGIKFGLYPNPADDIANVRIELEEAAQMDLFVSDLSGKVIFTSNLGDREAGVNTVQLNTNTFAKGLYQVTLKYNGNSITRPLIVK
jgi:hypothetical protein